VLDRWGVLSESGVDVREQPDGEPGIPDRYVVSAGSLARQVVAMTTASAAGLVALHMTSSVLLTIAASLTAGLLAVVALAIAPTIWTLVLAGVVLVAGAGAVAAAVTRTTAQEDA
jgi:hypothetical protein